MSNLGVVYKAADVQKTGDREYDFVGSDESEDSYGDIVFADGWDLKRYKKNPIVLFGHDARLPIGYSKKVAVENKRLIHKIKLADEGTSEFIDTIAKLMDQKIVKAVSVGFQPTKEPEVRRDKDGNFQGFDFHGQELLELSVVSIPANPNALSLAKSWGVKDATIRRMVAQDAFVRNANNQRRLALLRLGASSVSHRINTTF